MRMKGKCPISFLNSIKMVFDNNNSNNNNKYWNNSGLDEGARQGKVTITFGFLTMMAIIGRFKKDIVLQWQRKTHVL